VTERENVSSRYDLKFEMKLDKFLSLAGYRDFYLLLEKNYRMLNYEGLFGTNM